MNKLYVDKDGTFILSNEELVRDRKGFWKNKGQRKKTSRRVSLLSKVEAQELFNINHSWNEEGISINEAIKKSKKVSILEVNINNNLINLKNDIQKHLNCRRSNSVLNIPEQYVDEILIKNIMNKNFNKLISEYKKIMNYNGVRQRYNIKNPLPDLVNIANNWKEEEKVLFLYKLSQ